MSDDKINTDVFSLDIGEAVLQWPKRLSSNDVADMLEWLEIVKRKVARVPLQEPPAAVTTGGETFGPLKQILEGTP